VKGADNFLEIRLFFELHKPGKFQVGAHFDVSQLQVLVDKDKLQLRIYFFEYIHNVQDRNIQFYKVINPRWNGGGEQTIEGVGYIIHVSE